ncbi:MAG: hypothetical protein WD534_07835 [Phycisphaeraceae bacterium]
MSLESFSVRRRLGLALLLGFALLILMIANSLPRNQPVQLSQIIAWFIPLVGFVWLVFWLVHFVDLMASPPQRFPGPHDKPIWAAVFILLVPLAPFAFWLWKQATDRRGE